MSPWSCLFQGHLIYTIHGFLTLISKAAPGSTMEMKVFWLIGFYHFTHGIGRFMELEASSEVLQNNYSATRSYIVLVRPNESRIKILVHNQKSSYCSALVYRLVGKWGANTAIVIVCFCSPFLSRHGMQADAVRCCLHLALRLVDLVRMYVFNLSIWPLLSLMQLPDWSWLIMECGGDSPNNFRYFWLNYSTSLFITPFPPWNWSLQVFWRCKLQFNTCTFFL